MRAIHDVDELNLPIKYKKFISSYLKNIADVSYIDKVILFGSCAKEAVHKFSDIDIFVAVNRDINEDEEFFISFHSLPTQLEEYVSADIIVQLHSTFLKYINTTCMLQKQINHFGVDLSGLIHQRS